MATCKQNHTAVSRFIGLDGGGGGIPAHGCHVQTRPGIGRLHRVGCSAAAVSPALLIYLLSTVPVAAFGSAGFVAPVCRYFSFAFYVFIASVKLLHFA